VGVLPIFLIVRPSASKKDGLKTPFPPFQVRLPLSPQGSLVDPQMCASNRSASLFQCQPSKGMRSF
jgi:hypothetical protein